MNTYFNRLCSVAFMVLVLSACGGGGGGGGGGTPTAKTTPRTITVIDGYIKGATKTVQQDWQYDHPEGLYSNVCSSAYMAPDQSLLVLYAIPQRMVGLDANKNIVFDFAYSDARRCSGFNATPVPFGNLNFSR